MEERLGEPGALFFSPPPANVSSCERRKMIEVVRTFCANCHSRRLFRGYHDVIVTHLGETFPVTVRADTCYACSAVHYSPNEVEGEKEVALMAHLARGRRENHRQ